MKKMKIAIFYRMTRATIVLLVVILAQTHAAGQMKSSTNSSIHFSDLMPNAQGVKHGEVISSKSFQRTLVPSDVSEVKQNAAYIQNGMKLDSILEYDFMGWQSKRFKTYFTYENGSLKTKRCVHFGKSYSDSLGITEVWTYNKLQQLEKYERLKKLTDWNDTIIVDEENTYEYLGDTLIVKTVSTLTRLFYTDGTYNDVKYEAGDVLYNNYQELYTYNEKGQLTAYKGGRWYDHIFYEYDESGNLIYRYNLPYYVENYSYHYVEQSIDITLRFFYFAGEVIPFDSITDWVENSFWHFDIDQFGRDSICLNHLGGYNNVSYSVFEYDAQSRPSYISISFRDEVDTTKWLEQGRLQYAYNSNNQLASFLQTYYDEHWNHWDTQNSKEYYYSEVKSAALEPAPDTVPGELKIYPNPASVIITIEGILDTQAQYHIYDLFGRQMLGGNLQNNTIDVSGLARGTYLLKLTNDSTSQIQRFVKH
jgi:hypothetical protein